METLQYCETCSVHIASRFDFLETTSHVEHTTVIATIIVISKSSPCPVKKDFRVLGENLVDFSDNAESPSSESLT